MLSNFFGTGFLFMYLKSEGMLMIHLVTDSCADIPGYLLQKYNITVVPLSIRVNGKEYVEGVDITPTEFYREMEIASELPKTSQPTPDQYAKTFQKLAETGDVLCLTVSSKLSGSYNSANLGGGIAGKSNIAVFDTLSCSLGQGLQVLKAAELIRSGHSLPTILDELAKIRSETNFVALLYTLENLVKGGRLNYFQGSLGKLLNIKIILHINQGSLEVLDKVRSRNKSIERFLEFIGAKCDDFSTRTVGITHLDNPTDAEFIAATIKERHRPREVIISEMGATIATYSGKGAIIVVF
jgi:DegV family protein with EDD domain